MAENTKTKTAEDWGKLAVIADAAAFVTAAQVRLDVEEELELDARLEQLDTENNAMLAELYAGILP